MCLPSSTVLKKWLQKLLPKAREVDTSTVSEANIFEYSAYLVKNNFWNSLASLSSKYEPRMLCKTLSRI